MTFQVSSDVPGDPARLMAGPRAGQSTVDKIREQYGLNDPLPLQYINWIIGIFTRGDFGFSFYYNRDVGQVVAERLPRTILLALTCHLLASIIGITLGINTSRYKPFRSTDFIRSDSIMAVESVSGPGFNLGIVTNDFGDMIRIGDTEIEFQVRG